MIELLVVIAIIGLLASIVLASLTSARAKSRDANRLATMEQLRNALELYATANNGSYPSTGNNWWGACPGFASHALTGASGYIPNLAPAYISSLPIDPSGMCSTGNGYIYNSNGTDYMLLSYGMVETFTQSTNPEKRPSYSGENDFAMYTLGASTW